MLKVEDLKGNEILKELSDEQLRAIEVMSGNDESTVISQRIGQIYGDIEKDILEASGIDKESGEKAYNYAKRVIGSFKESASSYTSAKEQLDKLKSDYETLKKEKGGGTALASKIKELELDIQAKTKSYNDLKGQFDTSKSEWEQNLAKERKANETFRIDQLFGRALQGVKARNGLTEKDFNDLIELRKAKILSEYDIEWTDEGKTPIFKDENGQIVNNAEKGQAPFTAGDLLIKRSGDLLESVRKQPGAGGKPTPAGGAGGSFSLSGATSRNQATELITTHLMGKGLDRTSEEFTKQHLELMKESGANELPLEL